MRKHEEHIPGYDHWFAAEERKRTKGKWSYGFTQLKRALLDDRAQRSNGVESALLQIQLDKSHRPTNPERTRYLVKALERYPELKPLIFAIAFSYGENNPYSPTRTERVTLSRKTKQLLLPIINSKAILDTAFLPFVENTPSLLRFASTLYGAHLQNPSVRIATHDDTQTLLLYPSTPSPSMLAPISYEGINVRLAKQYQHALRNKIYPRVPWGWNQFRRWGQFKEEKEWVETTDPRQLDQVGFPLVSVFDGDKQILEVIVMPQRYGVDPFTSVYHQEECREAVDFNGYLDIIFAQSNPLKPFANKNVAQVVNTHLQEAFTTV